jgi:hypothetical protein
MSLCPTMDRCSTPRLLPLPRHFLPYFKNRDQSMDRELFRCMIVKWIRETAMTQSKANRGACRCAAIHPYSF